MMSKLLFPIPGYGSAEVVRCLIKAGVNYRMLDGRGKYLYILQVSKRIEKYFFA